MNNNTRGGIILIACKYICEIIFVIGFFITIKRPNNIPKIIENIADIKLNFIVTHKPYRSLSKFVPFDKKQIYLYVIIPQIIRRLIPLSVNLITRMIKTTSLVVLIGIVEVLKVGQQIIDTNRFQYPSGAIWIYGVIFLLYFLSCWPLSILAKFLEKRWSKI